MTIRKSNKPLCYAAVGLLAICLSLPVSAQDAEEPPADTPAVDEPATADTADDAAQPAAPEAKKDPRRAASFREALEAAGDDGVAVYCYGPDWNLRSARMLKSFWQTPELEAATGNAILVAVPYYEDPTDAQKDESDTASAGMRPPPFGVCPTVMLFDKDGVKYADLTGCDNLGDEQSFAIGYNNLREKMDAMRRRRVLMEKAENTSGAEKARILNEVAELPITPPPNLVEMIREADPGDQSGMVRRNTFKALDFLYEQMGTKDGFLSPDFVVDFRKLEAACLKVAKDETLRPEDRQAAYLLLIGASRRQEITGPKLRTIIQACAKIAPNSKYGRLSGFLTEKWVPLKFSHTSEERSKQRKQEREKNKERKEKERDEKRAAKNTEIR